MRQDSRSSIGLTIAALGVAYGDIGTSPIYAVNQIFFGFGNLPATPANILGAISLIVWTLTLIVSVKYMAIVLRADNDGEGGVFALYGLLHRYKRARMLWVLNLLILAAGLLIGEGIVTPAISVLSAVEGLGVVTPLLNHLIVPSTLAILCALFVIQRHGTAKVGRVFGPVVILWFLMLAWLGARQIIGTPGILAALYPGYGIELLLSTPFHGALLILGSAMLAITGVEALFADMGHFGKFPIRMGWFCIVYPALLLNYLGQGAFLLSGAEVVSNNLFFSLVPKVLLIPMVVLATLATSIAAQALISGSYSLAAQAIALGILPRLKVVHTHEQHAGQIYVPFVNLILFLGCTSLVLIFRSSNALAAAYGFSVSGVMLSSSLALIPLARLYWNWSWPRTLLTLTPIALLDLSFLTANSLKLHQGGFIPLSIGLFLFLIMTTWRWGRRVTFSSYSQIPTMRVRELVELKKQHPSPIERNLVLMAPRQLRSENDLTPALLQLFWERYGVLPQNLIFVDIVHKKVPYLHESRYHVREFLRDPSSGSITGVTVFFGFMEDPDVEAVLEELANRHEIELPENPLRWVVHVSLERLIPTADLSLLSRTRLKLFSFLRQISQPAHYYYGLGDKVHLTMEIMPIRIGMNEARLAPSVLLR